MNDIKIPKINVPIFPAITVQVAFLNSCKTKAPATTGALK